MYSVRVTASESRYFVGSAPTRRNASASSSAFTDQVRVILKYFTCVTSFPPQTGALFLGPAAQLGLDRGQPRRGEVPVPFHRQLEHAPDRGELRQGEIPQLGLQPGHVPKEQHVVAVRVVVGQRPMVAVGPPAAAVFLPVRSLDHEPGE